MRKGEISIFPLKLFTVAICLHLRERGLGIPGGRRIIVRNDNESACLAINTGLAYSLAMLEALRIFKKVEGLLRLRVMAENIPGEGKEIADDLSRGRLQRARMRIANIWPKALEVTPPRELKAWVQRLIEAGRADKKRA